MHTSRRLLLAAACMIAALMAAVAVALLATGSPTVMAAADPAQVLKPVTEDDIAAAPAADVTRWQARLGGCPEQEEADWNSPSCLGTAWWMALQQGQLPAFYAAMSNVNEQRTTRQSLCHVIGHSAGRKAFEEYKNAPALMRMSAPGEMSCDNGFLHGVLDAFAHSGPTQDQVESVVATCVAITEPRMHAACTDGMGHSAWLATKDPVKAAQWCLMLPVAHDTVVCVTGIVMQVLRNGYEGEPAPIALEEAHLEVPTLCQRIVDELRVSDDVAESCFTEVSAAFTTLASPVTWAWVEGSAVGYTSRPAWGEVESAWKEAFGKCDHLDARWRPGCRLDVAESVVWATLGDRATVERLCAIFPEARQRERCLAANRDEV